LCSNTGMTLYNIRERWLDEDEDDEDDEDNPDENDLGNFQSDSDSESDDTGYDDPLHSAAISREGKLLRDQLKDNMLN